MNVDNACEMVEYFGSYLHNVNTILLRIGLREDRPGWLQGKPRLADLDRWSETLEGSTVGLPRHVKPNALGDRIIWIVEELHGQWKLGTTGFVFEDVHEALHFKLRWS
jgi:hypothetical protein